MQGWSMKVLLLIIIKIMKVIKYKIQKTEIIITCSKIELIDQELRIYHAPARTCKVGKSHLKRYQEYKKLKMMVILKRKLVQKRKKF